jgi:hypothetical protein
LGKSHVGEIISTRSIRHVTAPARDGQASCTLHQVNKNTCPRCNWIQVLFAASHSSRRAASTVILDLDATDTHPTAFIPLIFS